MTNTIDIRDAQASDAKTILHFINELAICQLLTPLALSS